jgi:hypothetical protein
MADTAGEVVCWERLGGVLRHYYRGCLTRIASETLELRKPTTNSIGQRRRQSSSFISR